MRAVATWLGAMLLVSCAGLARADEGEEVARAKAAFIAAHGDLPISALRIEGLRRTDPAVVQEWITCRVNEPLSACDLAHVRERLDHLGIFSEIAVRLSPLAGSVAVTFHIEEKWSLYPVPMLWYTPGTELAGLVIADANLFGDNKGLAVGGVYSNRGWYTIAGYNDPNIAFSDAWGSLHAFLGSSEVENDAPDGSIEQLFHMTRFDLEWSLGWTFAEHFSPTWNGAVRVARVRNASMPGPEPATDQTTTTQALQLIYTDRHQAGLFDQGTRVALEGMHGFPLDARSTAFNAADLDAKSAHPAPLGGNLEAAARVYWGDMPVVFEERLGGLTGSRTLPGSALVAADRYGSLSLEYQAPLVTVPLGTLAGVGFGEVGRYARNAEPAVNYGGPGAGLRIYLKRVAIPAVGVDAGYEWVSKRVSFSIAIGYKPAR